jgi:hypothetical protein
VAKWCREFEAGRNYIHEKIRSGRPSIVTEEITQKLMKTFRADRGLTIDKLHQQCPEVSTIVLHG